MKSVSFIVHGKLSQRKKEELERKTEERLGDTFKLHFFETFGPKDATDLACKAVDGGTDYLIAVGGDGLLNETINGYMLCDENKRKDVIVGTLPYGTGNDFAKTIHVKPGIDHILELIEQGKHKPVDVGEMQFTGIKGEPEKRCFINISDIGIGGYVSQRVNQSSKLLGSNLSYMKAIVLSFLTYEHKKVRLKADDFEWEGPILLICVANGRYFGSGLCIAPQAIVDDGMIQLVLLANVSLLDYLRNMSRVKRCEIIDHQEVTYKKVKTCRVEALDPNECTIDMDGEFIGYGPMEVKMHAKEVQFLRP